MDDPILKALKRELTHAKGTKPGGQPSDPRRVAEVEAAIRERKGEPEVEKPRRGRPPKERAVPPPAEPVEELEDRENVDLTDAFETTVEP